VDELAALRRTIETAGDAFVAIDSSGRVVGWNRRAEVAFGWTESEAIGKRIDTLIIPARLRNNHRDGLARFVASGIGKVVGQTLELPALRKDGTEFPVELSVWAVEEDDGYHFNALIRDISLRKSVEAALLANEHRFRLTFAASPIGLALVDLDGRWLQVNPALCRIVDRREDDLLELTFQDITHPDDVDADVENVRLLIADEIPDYEMEKRYIRPDNTIVSVLLKVALVRDEEGQPLYFISQIVDMTERKRVESQLARQAEQLAQSNADLSQFASVAAHDLRAPLGAIGAFADLVLEDEGETLDPRALEFVRHIKSAAERTGDLVNDLLSYSRVGTDDVRREPVPLHVPVKAVVDLLEVELERRRAVVTIDQLPVVVGDPTQLHQLFQNLIGNAVKFVPPDRQPRVRVTSRPHPLGTEISVTDNGIGIDPEYRERVFMMFQRLHPQAAYPGTGIGLAICKRVVERHGGTISIEGAEPNGTAIRFTLPTPELAAS